MFYSLVVLPGAYAAIEKSSSACGRIKYGLSRLAEVLGDFPEDCRVGRFNLF